MKKDGLLAFYKMACRTEVSHMAMMTAHDENRIDALHKAYLAGGAEALIQERLKGGQ